MRVFLLFCAISVISTNVSGSFLNPYPEIKFFSDYGDSGDALYLTEYIENGDIETVS